MDNAINPQKAHDRVIIQGFSVVGGIASMVCAFNFLELSDIRLIIFLSVLLTLNCLSALIAYFYGSSAKGTYGIWWSIQIIMCPALVWLGFSLLAAIRRFNSSAAVVISILEIFLILLTISFFYFPFKEKPKVSNARIQRIKHTTYYVTVTLFSLFLLIFEVAKKMDVFQHVILNFLSADLFLFLAAMAWKLRIKGHGIGVAS